VSHKISDEVAVALMLSKNLKPLEPYPGRAKPWKSLCQNCNNTVSPRFASIQRSQGGCIHCANRATIGEEQARKIFKNANLMPLVPYEGSRKGWQSKCLICGQISNPRVDTVKNRGAKCRFCSAKERGLSGRMSQEDAFELARKANLEPLEPYQTSQKKWKCKCLKCNSIVYPQATTLQRGQGGCLKCGYAENKRKQLTPQDEAIAFFNSKGFTPIVPYPGANRPWESMCRTCGELVSPQYNSVKSGRGCGVCAGRIVPPHTANAKMQE
jgi:formylmethanofuran dehydrogenase subunit E